MIKKCEDAFHKKMFSLSFDKVATSSYNMYMKSIKTVGIKALKDQLSEYLRYVKTGSVVLITDRGNIIAELHEPSIEINPKKNHSILSEWINEGQFLPPKTKKKNCPISPVKLKAGTAKNLLAQERGE